ncbi:MAG: hypothetical protein AAGU11_15030 [Syntrophobacteraceae bacterium]
MISVRKLILCSATLLAGFTVGSALSVQPAVSKGITLFQALQGLGQDSPSVLYRGSIPDKKVVSLGQIQTLAASYNRKATVVSGIYVLEPKLSTTGSASQRLEALQSWVDGLGGGNQLLGSHHVVVRAEAKKLLTELGPGEYPLAKLKMLQRERLRQVVVGWELQKSVAAANEILQAPASR